MPPGVYIIYMRYVLKGVALSRLQCDCGQRCAQFSNSAVGTMRLARQQRRELAVGLTGWVYGWWSTSGRLRNETAREAGCMSRDASRVVAAMDDER